MVGTPAPKTRAAARSPKSRPGSADEAFSIEHRRDKAPTEAGEEQQSCHQAEDRAKGLWDDVEQDQCRQNKRREAGKRPSDWATRTSLALVETAIPAQIEQPARSGVNKNKMSRCELVKIADVTDG